MYSNSKGQIKHALTLTKEHNKGTYYHQTSLSIISVACRLS